MPTLGPFRAYKLVATLHHPVGFLKLGVPTIMENQMEKQMENEMETGII